MDNARIFVTIHIILRYVMYIFQKTGIVVGRIFCTKPNELYEVDCLDRSAITR